MIITAAQRQAIGLFLAQLEGKYTIEQFLAAGKYWAKDSPIWRHIRQNGTQQIRLVCWYNYTYKPGSNEFKPAVLIQAMLEHLKTANVETTPATQSHHASRPAGNQTANRTN